MILRICINRREALLLLIAATAGVDECCIAFDIKKLELKET